MFQPFLRFWLQLALDPQKRGNLYVSTLLEILVRRALREESLPVNAEVSTLLEILEQRSAAGLLPVAEKLCFNPS